MYLKIMMYGLQRPKW